MRDWTLTTPHVEAVVSPLGGMMAPVWFTLPGGRRVQPFKLTDWADQPEAVAFPPVMRFLKGDFACAPYGAPAPAPSVAERWASLFVPHEAFTETHGVCANHDWTLVSRSEAELLIAIDYPAEHPVGRVEKRIALDDAGLAVSVELTIHARAVLRIACGVHPVFDVGDAPGRTIVETTFGFGRTFPGEYVPGAGRFAHDRRFDRLDRVPGHDGGTVDASRLPFADPIDEVLQLCAADGRLRLRRPDAGYAIELAWDAARWPSCLLWIASGGRQAPPFDGAFRALAVEPVAAAFGIGSSISANPANPIAQDGVRTWIELDPATPWSTSYRFSVMAEAASSL